jgi:hypothetical protein
MHMSSDTKDEKSDPPEAPSQALIDAAMQRAEHAEARARALEAENRELRSARARTALSASETEQASLRAAHAEAKARSLEAENQQLKSSRAQSTLVTAETAPRSLEAASRRAEAAEAQARAFEAENRQLRAERTKAFVAAARAESAKAESGPPVADEAEERLAALSNELKMAEAAAHTLEGSLRREFSERLDAMRRSHTAELEIRSREAKTRFAEELMSAVSSANAAWKKDTEAQLRDAKRKAEEGLARARTIWRLRSRVALLQAARVWHGRERQRLRDAKRKWDAAHREALDACNRRWRAKVDRLKKRMRRPRWAPHWQPAAWRTAIERPFVGAGLVLRSVARAIQTPRPRPTPAGDAGFVAVIVLLLAIFLPPTALFSADASVNRTQVASLPDAQAPDAHDEAAALLNGRPKAPPPPRRSDHARERAADRHATASPADAAAGSKAGSAAEEELRVRLLEKIRKLRTDLSGG